VFCSEEPRRLYEPRLDPRVEVRGPHSVRAARPEPSRQQLTTGDCTHEYDRDVVLARVPDTQRIIFDTILAGLHERMRPALERTQGSGGP